MARVAPVEKVATEEGAEASTRVEHARYDEGERDSEGSLVRLLPPLCDACTLLTSFEEIGEGTQGTRGGTGHTNSAVKATRVIVTTRRLIHVPGQEYFGLRFSKLVFLLQCLGRDVEMWYERVAFSWRIYWVETRTDAAGNHVGVCQNACVAT